MSGVDIQQLVRPGEVLAGKYRIERVLGQGGMGVVVAAHHIQLDERVAIKFLLSDAVKRTDLVQRFEREARAAVKIKSEHVARVIDVGVLENGAPFMVMEFLEGVDLAARVQDEGPVPWQQASDFILQACEAIVEAHALGIIHRDLKPANLFLLRRADGLLSIKVLDFGISKSTALSGSGGSDMTQTQSMLGSPFYMSPEQMQSARSVDMRTDIWALGVILYQLVMGVVPFEAETLPELVLKIVQQPPPSMRFTRPDIPTGFEHVVMRCLEKDRERRYAHIGELATALVAFAPERSRSSAERILRVVQTSGLGTAQHRPSQPMSAAVQGQKNATQLVAPVSIPMAPSSSEHSPVGQASRPGSGGNPPFVDSRPGQQPMLQHTAPHPSGGPSAIGPPLGMPPPGHTHPQPSFGVTSSSQSWQSSGPQQVPKNNTLAIVLALLSFTSIIGVAVFVGRQVLMSRTPAVPSASVSVATAAPPPSAVPSATAAVSTTPPDPAVETHDAGIVATATPDASVPIIVRPPPPGPAIAAPPPAPAPGPAPGPAPATKPGCTPPWSYDKQGNKAFKPECL